MARDIERDYRDRCGDDERDHEPVLSDAELRYFREEKRAREAQRARRKEMKQMLTTAGGILSALVAVKMLVGEYLWKLFIARGP